MKIARSLLKEIIDHARRDAPNECCGVVSVANGGDAHGVFALKNLAASPLRFEVGADLVPVMEEIDDAGHELGAIYHSHTRTAPYPSQTDVNFSANWPGVEWIIVGLAGDDAEVRSYRIEGGRIEEVELEVA
jgi:[CysO sulfur-carrier protein]-S-L-cysteine hydrolase